MAVRKWSMVAAVLLFLLSSYLYLINKYNPDTVEFYFSGSPSKSNIRKLLDTGKGKVSVVNFTMPYKGHRLIMTTGFDTMTEIMPLQKGSWQLDMGGQQAVIGDKVADEYFNSANAVGNKITVYDRSYEIKGIIRNSNDIYVPYDDKLQTYNWQRKTVKCNLENDKYFYLNIETLETQFNAMGLEVFDVIVYKEKLYGYINLAICIALCILVYFAAKLVKHNVRQIKKLVSIYRLESRTTEWSAYMVRNSSALIKILFSLLSLLILAFCFCSLLRLLEIPPSMVPDNLFSLDSYVKVIRLNYETYLLHMRNGAGDMLIDVKIINGILLLLVLCMLTVKRAKDI